MFESATVIYGEARQCTLMTIRSGDFVAQHIDDGEVPDEAVQPNGVDLAVGTIYRQTGPAVIGANDYEKPERNEAPLVDVNGSPHYKLPPGAYTVVYNEKIRIPENHVGFVAPRSRIMRSGGTIISAYWDAGYEGFGEGLLITHSDMYIDLEARIAQMAFIETEDLNETYDGSHQGERL